MSNDPVISPKECTNFPKVKGMFLVKKGMAQKAMLKNIATGNTKKLSKQIAKGTVQYFANL